MFKFIKFFFLLQILTLGLHADPNEDLGEAVYRDDEIATAKALANGADVNYAPDNSVTPLHTAANHGAVKVVKLLLKAGANIKAHDSGGRTPLWEAIGNDHVEVVKLLIGAGADLSNPHEGYTLLMWASTTGSKKVAELLLKHKIPIDAQAVSAESEEFGSGFTALMHASLNGNIEIVRLLLASKANVDLKTSTGFTALEIAVRFRKHEIADLLRKKGAKM